MKTSGQLTFDTLNVINETTKDCGESNQAEKTSSDEKNESFFTSIIFFNEFLLQ